MAIFSENEIDDLSKMLQYQAVYEYARDIILKSFIKQTQPCPCCNDGRISISGVHEVSPGTRELRFIPRQEALQQLVGVRHAYLDCSDLILTFKSGKKVWEVRPFWNGKRWEQTPDGRFIPPKEWRDQYSFPGEVWE